MLRLESLISKKSRDIPPFLVMDVLERAVEMERAGQNVIHLEVGEPDFDTPANIVQAGFEALRAGRTRFRYASQYSPSRLRSLKGWENPLYTKRWHT